MKDDKIEYDRGTANGFMTFCFLAESSPRNLKRLLMVPKSSSFLLNVADESPNLYQLGFARGFELAKFYLDMLLISKV